MKAKPAFAVAAAMSCWAAGAAAQSNLSLESVWAANGSVFSIADGGSVVYLGGTFSNLGPYTGGFSRIDPVTGSPDLAFRKVDGLVLDIAPDGTGGWYVAGFFSRVGGTARGNLAHVLADGRISSWNPAPNGPVNAIIVDAGTVHVGGTFSTIAGMTRNSAASFNAANGTLSSWDPNVTGTVLALTVQGPDVFLAGNFTAVGGVGRLGLAKVSATGGGVLDPVWNPSAAAGINFETLLASGSTLYVAFNSFSATVGGATRGFLAALNTTGTGAATAWDPQPNGTIRSMALSSGTLYLGGFFSMIGNPTPVTRNDLAAVDALTGAVKPWDPNSLGGGVFSLVVSGGLVYAGGFFSSMGGQPRSNLAAVDDVLGVPTAWNPRANDSVKVVAAGNGSVYAGGDFSSVGIQDRACLAALDAATGALTSWNPGADNPVKSVAVGGGTVYVGGQFTSVGGTPRNFLAAVDTAGNLVPTWDPSPNNFVGAIAVSGSRVIVGGEFTTIGTPSLGRSRIAALDAASAANLWSFGANARVNSLFVSGSTVYAGGDFTGIGAALRNRIAALDVTNGQATTPWNPDASGGALPTVNAIVSTPAFVYAGGEFTTIGGLPRTNIAALDATGTGPATSWDPNPVGGPAPRMNAIALAGSKVVVGGNFFTIGGLTRPWVASLDAATGSANAWDVDANSEVAALSAAGRRLYVGGIFTSIAGQRRTGLGAFCLNDAPTGLAAMGAGNNRIDLTWAGTGAPEYRIYRSLPGGPSEFIGSTNATFFVDDTAHGGVSYTYIVRAFDECESDDSAGMVGVANGACGLPPTFEGIGWAMPDTGATCSVKLAWGSASSPCGGGGSVTYSLYRDTSPTFTPDVTNRIATNLTSTNYDDRAALSPGTTYYYAARATAVVNGEEDSNLIRFPVTPSGCTATAPRPLAFFTVRSIDSENTLEWLNPPVPYDRTRICFRTDTYPTGPGDGTCTDHPGTPGNHVVLPDPAPNGITRFYAAFADATGTGVYSSPKFSFGRPDVVSGSFQWSYATGATALGPVGVSRTQVYVAGSNDRVLHGMTGTPVGGTWPTGWTPFALNGPAQSRPTVIRLPITRVMGADTIALLGSQDGRVYAINATSGALLWTSPVLGTAVQASPGAIFTDLGGAYDLVLVGSRTPAGESKFYALHLANGTIAWSFDNGGGGNAIGIISGSAQVQYSVPPLVYFTSRRRGGGSGDSVWALSFTDTSPTKLWSQNVGDADAGPVLRNGRLYVGNNAGEVQALDPATGNPIWTAPYATLDGPIKGGVFPAGSVLIFSTTANVHAITDNGPATTPTPFWTGGAASGGAVPLGSPSPPLLRGGRVYVGGDASRVYSIDYSTPNPAAPTSVVLGDPAVPKVAGAPTVDTIYNLIIVGTDQGAFYAVTEPF